jgi:hypothetical protein
MKVALELADKDLMVVEGLKVAPQIQVFMVVVAVTA